MWRFGCRAYDVILCYSVGSDKQNKQQYVNLSLNGNKSHQFWLKVL